MSAVDEKGRHQTTELGFGDIWYFPKGQAHTVQGLDDENEYLLAFDDADFDRAGFVTYKYVLVNANDQKEPLSISMIG